ncbi:hypothetical protein ACEPPN_006323 [Leptodophora sp. 'Broadleaf-Isolate-01']
MQLDAWHEARYCDDLTAYLGRRVFKSQIWGKGPNGNAAEMETSGNAAEMGTNGDFA